MINEDNERRKPSFATRIQKQSPNCGLQTLLGFILFKRKKGY